MRVWTDDVISLTLCVKGLLHTRAYNTNTNISLSLSLPHTHTLSLSLSLCLSLSLPLSQGCDKAGDAEQYPGRGRHARELPASIWQNGQRREQID